MVFKKVISFMLSHTTVNKTDKVLGSPREDSCVCVVARLTLTFLYLSVKTWVVQQ